MNQSIGLAITTKNREKAFSMCYDKHLEFQPPNSRIFVVDDGSDPSYANYDIRNIESKGISSSKNSCLQLMHESGCDHLFCFDDDTHPIAKDWHLPYINSGEHHLCATFIPKNGTFKKMICKDFSEGTIYCSSHYTQEFKTHQLGNGHCLYFTRHCIETVGGFDTRYPNKYEHCDLSRRIHNAGLTKYVYQDVINSNGLIYCLDQDNAIERSFSKQEMNQNLRDGYDLFRSQANSKEYIEFRT